MNQVGLFATPWQTRTAQRYQVNCCLQCLALENDGVRLKLVDGNSSAIIYSEVIR